MRKKDWWITFAKEAKVILEDIGWLPIERIRLWWGTRFLSALRRKERRQRFEQGLEDNSIKGAAITASLQLLEIERIEFLCRKYNIPLPKPSEPETIDGLAVVQRHWYFDDDIRIPLLDSLDEARARRSEQQRAWLLALTGAVGTITGLMAVLLSRG